MEIMGLRNRAWNQQQNNTTIQPITARDNFETPIWMVSPGRAVHKNNLYQLLVSISNNNNHSSAGNSKNNTDEIMPLPCGIITGHQLPSIRLHYQTVTLSPTACHDATVSWLIAQTTEEPTKQHSHHRQHRRDWDRTMTQPPSPTINGTSIPYGHHCQPPSQQQQHPHHHSWTFQSS